MFASGLVYVQKYYGLICKLSYTSWNTKPAIISIRDPVTSYALNQI